MDSNNFLFRWLDEKTGQRAARESLLDKIEQLSREAEALQGAVQYLVEDAYWEGPMSIAPSTVLDKLTELDSGLIDDLIDRRRWEVLGGMGSSVYTDHETARRRAIENTDYLYIYNPLVKWMINVWTNYGVGDSVRISCNNEDADDFFAEFWNANRNADIFSPDVIHYLSTFTLRKGNVFIAFFTSKADGRSTAELIPSVEIVEIITAPGRKSEELFYKRQYSDTSGDHVVYYPDWQAKMTGRLTPNLVAKVLPRDAVRADMWDHNDVLLNDIEENLGTDCAVMHVCFNRIDEDTNWGWPLLTNTAYIGSHKRFFEDRLTVSAAKSMYVRRKKVQGNARAIDGIRRTIASTYSAARMSDTNPPAGAGSVEIENQAVDTTDLPMTTGAGDAKADNEMFSWMALLEGGIFPTTAGLDTSRWATALAMDKTLAMQWSRYQTFWSSQFQKIVKIVLGFGEMYGGYQFVDENGEQDHGCTVNIDTLSLVDFPDVVNSLSSASRDILLPYLQQGTIDDQTARMILRELWLIMLQALGLSRSFEIASKEAFGIEESDSIPKPVSSFLRSVQKMIKENDLEGLGDYLEKTAEGR